jgi:hypothetical protein
LKEFVVFVEFEIIFEKSGISLGFASNQLTERVIKPFDSLALVSSYFLHYKHLSIARR